LWDLLTGECLQVSAVQENSNLGILLDVAKQRFISLDVDNSFVDYVFGVRSLKVWHMKDLTFDRKIDVKDVKVLQIAKRAQRELICFVQSGEDCQVDLLNIDSEQLDTLFSPVPQARFGAHSPLAVSSVRVAIVVKDPKNVEIWEGKEHRCLHVLAGHREDILCADFSPDGNYLLTGSRDRTVRLWDMTSGECVRVFANRL